MNLCLVVFNLLRAKLLDRGKVVALNWALSGRLSLLRSARSTSDDEEKGRRQGQQNAGRPQGDTHSTTQTVALDGEHYLLHCTMSYLPSATRAMISHSRTLRSAYEALDIVCQLFC